MAVSKSRFLTIPQEMRDLIYAPLLREKRPSRLPSGRIIKLIPVAFVCKQLRVEVTQAAQSVAIHEYHFKSDISKDLDPEARDAIANDEDGDDDKYDDGDADDEDGDDEDKTAPNEREMLMFLKFLCSGYHCRPTGRNHFHVDYAGVEEFADLFLPLTDTKLLVLECTLYGPDAEIDKRFPVHALERSPVWAALFHELEDVLTRLPALLEFSIRIDGKCGLWERRPTPNTPWQKLNANSDRWCEELSLWWPGMGLDHGSWRYGGRPAWTHLLSILQLKTEFPEHTLDHLAPEYQRECVRSRAGWLTADIVDL